MASWSEHEVTLPLCVLLSELLCSLFWSSGRPSVHVSARACFAQYSVWLRMFSPSNAPGLPATLFSKAPRRSAAVCRRAAPLSLRWSPFGLQQLVRETSGCLAGKRSTMFTSLVANFVCLPFSSVQILYSGFLELFHLTKSAAAETCFMRAVSEPKW